MLKWERRRVVFQGQLINASCWSSGKQGLLPIGRCIDDPDRDRIYATHFTKAQLQQLPEYNDNTVVDIDYEEQVRAVYCMTSVETSAPVETSVPVEQSGGYVVLNQAYDYNHEPMLYSMNDTDHKRLRLYEERLVANKIREKTGGVTVSKRIETDVETAEVPIQKEKIVIEIDSTKGNTRVNMPDDSFEDGEVARLDVYEEKAEIRKEPVVHQEVTIRKETDTDVVTARERLRREALEVQKKGQPSVTEHSQQIDR